MITVILALAAQAVVLPPLRPIGNPICRHDRAAMLALSEDAFDQDLNRGWRALVGRGCERAAADLIAAWRAAHGKRQTNLTAWHEGQLRADVGETAQAITLLDRARKTGAEDAGWGWNLYVDGTLAFLRRDRAALQAARDHLAGLPPPPDLAAARDRYGKPISIRWPMNLEVLDALLRCFNSDYRTAYGACPARSGA